MAWRNNFGGGTAAVRAGQTRWARPAITIPARPQTPAIAQGVTAGRPAARPVSTLIKRPGEEPKAAPLGKAPRPAVVAGRPTVRPAGQVGNFQAAAAFGGIRPAKVATAILRPSAGTQTAKAGAVATSIPTRRVVYLDELAMPKRPEVAAGEKDRELFLSSLPVPACDEEKIKDFFEGFGKVEHLHLLRGKGNTLTGQGYVRFAKHSAAVAVLAAQSSAVDREEGDFVAAWSESERAAQRAVGVYGLDLHAQFATSNGRVFPNVYTAAKVKELWMFSEVLHMKVPGAPTADPQGKQLHFVTNCDDSQLEALKEALSQTLQGFHAKVTQKIEGLKEQGAQAKPGLASIPPTIKRPGEDLPDPAAKKAKAGLILPKGKIGAALVAGPGQQKREELIGTLFREFDADQDKHLNMEEMRKFGVLMSSVFKEKQWSREYGVVCSEGGADPFMGVDAALFSKLLTEPSKIGVVCRDHELKLMLDHLHARKELIEAMFKACDTDQSGLLSAAKLRLFAQHTGFEGDDAMWTDEYKKLCDEVKVDPAAGIDSDAFSQIVNDQSTEGGCYCSDEELFNMLKEMNSAIPPLAARVYAKLALPKKGVIVPPPKKGQVKDALRAIIGQMGGSPPGAPAVPTSKAALLPARAKMPPPSAKSVPKAKTPGAAPDPRAELIREVFTALDVDGDGVLSMSEMQRFAEQTGFDGSDEAWAETYKGLCTTHGHDSGAEIDVPLFEKLVNDQSEDGLHCPSAELKTILAKIKPPDVPRDELVRAVFEALDRDRDGNLNEKEMRAFAEFGGFSGSDETWAKEYQTMTAENAAAKGSVTPEFFSQLVNGGSHGNFSDPELHAMLQKLEKKAQQGSQPAAEAARGGEAQDPAAREKLIRAVFNSLDADRDGKLNVREMQRFAEFGGFSGSDEAWAKEYNNILQEAGAEGQQIVDWSLFLQLVNDESYDTGMYTKDAELQSMLAKMGTTVEAAAAGAGDAEAAAAPMRTDLIHEVFVLLDADKDGALNRVEMRRFAEYTGFAGTDKEWAEAYQGMCDDGKRDSAVGIDLVFLSKLLNDKSDTGCHCADDELRDMRDWLKNGGTAAQPSDSADQRETLVKEFFGILDADKDGKLNKVEMRKFAEQTGFEGGDSEWAENYKSLCEEAGADESGVTLEVFTKLVNDKSEDAGCYCTDEELRQFIEKLKS